MPVKKRKTTRKNITLEDLAVMTQRGFADMTDRFDRVEKDVSMLKKDVRILKEDVAVLKEDVATIKEDVVILKEDVVVLKEDTVEIKGTLASLDRRLMFIEDKITEHSKEIRKLRELIEKFLEDKDIDHEKIVWLEKRIEILEAKAGIKVN